MLYTLSVDRMDFPYAKNAQGKRCYDQRKVSASELLDIRKCCIRGLGLSLDEVTR